MGQRVCECSPWSVPQSCCAAERYVRASRLSTAPSFCTHRSAAHFGSESEPWAALASSLTHGYGLCHLRWRGSRRQSLSRFRIETYSNGRLHGFPKQFLQDGAPHKFLVVAMLEVTCINRKNC